MCRGDEDEGRDGLHTFGWGNGTVGTPMDRDFFLKRAALGGGWTRDFLRRIIEPVEGQGGVTLSYVSPRCPQYPREGCTLWVSTSGARRPRPARPARAPARRTEAGKSRTKWCRRRGSGSQITVGRNWRRPKTILGTQGTWERRRRLRSLHGASRMLSWFKR